MATTTVIMATNEFFILREYYMFIYFNVFPASVFKETSFWVLDKFTILLTPVKGTMQPKLIKVNRIIDITTLFITTLFLTSVVLKHLSAKTNQQISFRACV